MKIKKLGHCCLVVEVNGKRIMTDPGSYTVKEQAQEKNVDLILITHEHGDHLHIESLQEIIKNNPNVKIITNAGVGKLLDEAGLKYEVLKNKTAKDILGVELEAHDCKHEEIFKEIGQVQNTGYFIGRKLFYPGDAISNASYLPHRRNNIREQKFWRGGEILLYIYSRPGYDICEGARRAQVVFQITLYPSGFFPCESGLGEGEGFLASDQCVQNR